MGLFEFLTAWGIMEGKRNEDVEEGPQDASVDEVLSKSAANLNARSGCDKRGFATVDLSSFIFISKQVSESHLGYHYSQKRCELQW